MYEMQSAEGNMDAKKETIKTIHIVGWLSIYNEIKNKKKAKRIPCHNNHPSTVTCEADFIYDRSGLTASANTWVTGYVTYSRIPMLMPCTACRASCCEYFGSEHPRRKFPDPKRKMRYEVTVSMHCN